MKLAAGMAVAVLILWAVVIPMPPSASGSDQEPAPPLNDDGAARRQAEQYAIDFGVDVQDALARDEFRSRLDPLIELAASDHPETFAGAVVRHGSPFEVELRFVGGVPPEVIEAANGLRVSTDDDLRVLLTGNASVTLVHLSQDAERMMDAAAAAGAPIVVAPNILDGALDVAVPSADSLLMFDPRDIAVSVPVELDIATEALAYDDHTYGGAKATKSSGFCTTGFTITRSGVSGVLLAGHCSNTGRSYVEPEAGGATYPMTHQSPEHIGYWGDVEWYTTPHDEFDDFYYSTSNARQDVASVKSANALAYGDYLCRFGRKTGYRCSQLMAWNVAKVINGTYTTYKLACTIHDTGESGDSGAPWFSGSTAWGVHQGAASISGSTRDCFTLADYVDEAIGATIKK